MTPMMLVALVAAYWLLGALLWVVRERRRGRKALGEAVARAGSDQPLREGQVIVASGTIDLRGFLAMALAGPLLAAAVWVLFG